jgi:C-terminal processing protease CtpA/Prc
VLTRSNYLALLNGRADTYTLGKAEQDASGAFLSTEGEVSLTRVENFQENPVQHHSIFLSGNKKVGYLVYNQFITAYSGELNEIFATFKSNAIDELIIDLRYNPGGSTAAAASLASMIHDGSGVFAKQRWNTYWTSMFGSGLEDRFTNEITVNNATVALNRLGMKRVYILTQSGTASSSELLINGLNPYIEVVQIGETTRGKNEFSITLVDDPGSQSGQTVFPYLFQSSRTDQINPNNRLALQPLVGKYENSQGFSDYTDGLEPLISYSEIEQVNGRIVFNLGPFGSLEDGLFAQAISHVNGGLANRRAVRSMGEAVEDLKPSEPLMFVEF